MRTAVLVIDMIEEFVRGKLGSEAARGVIPSIRRLLEFSRSKGIPVVHVKDSHIRGVDPELSLWGDHAISGTSGSEIVHELRPESRDYVLEKRTYSAFFETGLDLLLRRLGVGRLVLTGVVTNICIQNTAADAFYRGYEILVPEECVGAPSEGDHRSALEYMRKIYGAKVVGLDELLELLEG